MSFCTCPKTKIILRLAGETLDTPARDDWVPLVSTPAALSSRHARPCIPPTPPPLLLCLVPTPGKDATDVSCKRSCARPWPILPAKTNTMTVAGSGTTFSDRLRTQKTKACLCGWSWLSTTRLRESINPRSVIQDIAPNETATPKSPTCWGLARRCRPTESKFVLMYVLGTAHRSCECKSSYVRDASAIAASVKGIGLVFSLCSVLSMH